MDELSELVIERIKEWVNRRPSRNLNTLSKASGIPHPTLSRIIKGVHQPSAKTVLALASHIFHIDEIDDVLTRYGVKQAALPPHRSDALREFDDFVVVDETDLLILGLLCRQSGTTRDSILQLFGFYGIKKLEAYLEKEIAWQQADGVCKISDDVITPDREKILSSINLSLNMMSKGSAERQVFFHEIFGVNEEGMEQLHSQTRQYYASVHQIIKDNRGELIAIVAGISAQMPPYQDEQS